MTRYAKGWEIGMMLCCGDLLRLPGIDYLTLVAGEGGLNRPIRWIYFGDNIDDMTTSGDWINGKELVLITGKNYAGHVEQLSRVLESMNEKRIAGFVINAGYYVDVIPQCVLDTANRLNLPLFTIPWEIKMVEFSYMVCSEILRLKDMTESDDELLRAVLQGKTEMPQAMLGLWAGEKERQDARLLVAACSSTTADGRTADSALLQVFKQQLVIRCSSYGPNSCMAVPMGYTLAVLTPALPEIKLHMGEIARAFEEKNPGACVRIGLSAPCELRKGVPAAYRQAELALAAANVCGSDARIMMYENIGFLALLLEIDNADLLSAYLQKTVQPLLDYDHANKTKYFQTLETYIQCDVDMTAAAAKLYVHKNTMKYRMEKINEILGCDLHTSDSLLRIHTGLWVYRILRYRGEEGHPAE